MLICTVVVVFLKCLVTVRFRFCPGKGGVQSLSLYPRIGGVLSLSVKCVYGGV